MIIVTKNNHHNHNHNHNSLSFIDFFCSLVEEVIDVLGNKQSVKFDDLAKLRQLGLVKFLF